MVSFLPLKTSPLISQVHVACLVTLLTDPVRVSGARLVRAHSHPCTVLLVNRNPNGEDLPHWPLYDQKEQYLQLNMQPTVGQALKAHRLQFWTKTLAQKIQAIMAAKESHTEL